MRSSLQAAGLIAALLAASAAVAQGSGEREDAPMMMDEESMSGMMGQDGMMSMMQQMGEMMETCNRMMQAMMEDGGMMTPGDGSDSPEAEGEDG